MFNIIKNHNTVLLKTKTLSAARDSLADLRKAALKNGRLANYEGRDCLNLGTLGNREIEITYTILEG
jgi:hypothetical protein